MHDNYVIKPPAGGRSSVPPRPSLRCPVSRPGHDFQLDQPPPDSARQVVLRAPRRPDAAHIWKVDRAVRLHARGRIQFGMIDDPDGDDIRIRQNATSGPRRRAPIAAKSKTPIQRAG